MLSAMLWYARNGAVTLTQAAVSYSRVGRLAWPAGPVPLIPNRLWSAVASSLCPQPDSSMGWAIVTAAGTPYRSWGAVAAGAIRLMNACWAAVPGAVDAGGSCLR